MRGRGAIVGVLVALLGVVGKVSFLSGGWSGHSVLLDPRFGGSDGLGILVDGRMNHHLQQLSSRGVAHNPRIMAGRCLVLLIIFPCFSAWSVGWSM